MNRATPSFEHGWRWWRDSAAPIARMVLDYYLLGKTPDGPAKDDEVQEEED